MEEYKNDYECSQEEEDLTYEGELYQSACTFT